MSVRVQVIPFIFLSPLVSLLLSTFSSDVQGVPSSLSSPSFVTYPRGKTSVSDWAISRADNSGHIEVSSKGFVDEPTNRRSVLLINGTADDSFVITLSLERGKLQSDYNYSFSTNDSLIIDPASDVALSQTESGPILNATIAIDFHNFPGLVSFTVQARRTTDNSLYDSVQVNFLVAGTVIYDKETNTIISGDGRSLLIPNYQDIFDKPHREFDVLTQFLNGSDSNALSPRSDDLTISTVEMSSIVPGFFVSFIGQILWDDSTCAIGGGSWVSEHLLLKPGCGMGFGNAYTNDTKYDGVRFALDFQRNRAGKFGIFFVWNGFTSSSEFEDEEYTTYLIAEIAGQPPAVVRRIEPANPFDKNGGEELYVETINTVDVNITSFNVNEVPFAILPESRTIVNGPGDFYETAKFLTVPGTGKRLPWTISATRSINGTNVEVPFIDETGFLFSYNDEHVILNSVDPNVVPEEGQVSVILSGSFPEFNPRVMDHNVFIGNSVIDKSTFVRASDSEITLIVPPRTAIGSGWEFNVSVAIGDSSSNELPLEFLPSSLSVRGQVFGTSFDDEAEEYRLNSCGNSTFIVTLIDHKETNNTQFSWKMLDEEKVDLLSLGNASGIVTNTDTLQLPNDFVPFFHRSYSVIGIVKLGRIESSSLFNVKKLPGYIIGVTLIQPENRTISTPPVNLRIVAKIEVPECVENFPDELVYVWELENKTQTIDSAGRMGLTPLSVHEATLPPEYRKYVFSFENDTGTFDDELTPTRLGREFIIPREFIEHGFHRVRLTVRGNDTKVVLKGSDSTYYTILESPLVVKIGTGQLSRRVSDAEEMTMSAKQSFDPDLIVNVNRSSGLQYRWSCEFSVYENLTYVEPCATVLLPEQVVRSSKFSIGPAALQVASSRTIEGQQGTVYLRYHVTISKDHRTRNSSQTILLTQAAGKAISRYYDIEIVNSRDEPVNPESVEFWDDVVMRPITPSSTVWRFRLELPHSERSRFLTSGKNLISRSGYYVTTGINAPGFQQLPLGISEDRLQPHQIYQFLITFQESGRLVDDVTVRLKTAEVPDLVFPSLTSWTGTTTTVFRATATTSFKGNSLFSYQFYLLESGRNTREYCVDGCTGAHTVRFQVSKPGNYSLQCRLLAANGKKLLAVKNNTRILTIFGRRGGVNFSEFHNDINQDYKLGDDGSVVQKGFFVSESIYENDGELVSMEDSQQTDLCADYTGRWARMSGHIITNELPNTPNVRNYVILAANYARLQCVEIENTLYELLAIVDRSITKTPQEEMLTMLTYSKVQDVPSVELEEDLRRFYNFTITRAASIIAEGSARSRIVVRQGVVNNLILDVMELWFQHVTAATTSGRVCGWEANYTLATADGEPDSSIVAEGSSPLGESAIHVAVNCNVEQGTVLYSPHASFEWCDAVYALSGTSRKLVTVAETFDYPYISGVQGANKSETQRLVMVDIATLGERNQLLSAITEETVVAAQAAEGRSSAAMCYHVGMKMAARTEESSTECWRNQVFTMWPRKSFGHQLKEPFEEDAYKRRTSGIITTPETKNSTNFVIAHSNELGLYGANRGPCSDTTIQPLQGTGPLLTGILIGILLLVLVITGLTYLLVTAIVGAGASEEEDPAMAGIAGYVERDYFGRKDIRLQMADAESSEGSMGASYRSGLSSMGASGGSRAGGSSRQQHDENMLGREPNDVRR